MDEVTEPSYTDRAVEVKTITKIDGASIVFTDGWCFAGAPADVLSRLVAGMEYLQETRNFSWVTGMATIYRTRSGEPVVDQWLWHKTDAELDHEHAELVARLDGEREARLDVHREDWARREVALPGPLRRRLERFRANGGHHFETSGWGYELVICELAVLYAASGQVDSDEVIAYADIEGTSGNQHDYAKALSRYLTDHPDDADKVANSIAALSPLTGDADYSGGHDKKTSGSGDSLADGDKGTGLDVRPGPTQHSKDIS